ncbi:MAG: tRNA 2-selenouridine(34) synthase MnmH [Draconibacterium sp.]|nr:tRNA 2-selenouridine(34) synthase MnmH [Draconibacterium sp.]
MVQQIEIVTFLELVKELSVIDVRSPGEFEKGHIPGAVNIPLFTNEERAHVGTVYKKESKEKAIEVGYKYVSPKLNDFIAESQKVAPRGDVIVHCWRGGMRSKAFANHLAENGFNNVFIIEGGYKAFRRFALVSFAVDAIICVVGGYTGSGKTHILNCLNEMGEQIIDLEGLANHKGSAFGGIENKKQPTVEQFENNLFWNWKELDYSKTIWVEDESHRIGNVNIPMTFYTNMRSKPLIFIQIPKQERIKHLVDEYASYPKNELIGSIERITKRLGGNDTQIAIQCVWENNFAEVADLMLSYYDKYYLRGLNNRSNQNNIFTLKSDSVNHKQNSEKIKEYYNAISKRRD